MFLLRKSTENQLGSIFSLPVKHRQEEIAKQKAEVQNLQCVPRDCCLSLWLLLNLL